MPIALATRSPAAPAARRPVDLARSTAAHHTARPSERELVFFSTRLALCLEMGSPLNRALGALASQIRDPRMARIVRLVQADVEDGMPLSAALGRHPRTFDPVFTSMVRAGESAGILPSMLARQADLLRRRRQFRAALRGSLTYPFFLVGLSVIVVAFMLVFVYPRFAPLLGAVRDTLPWTTRALLGAGVALRQHGAWIGLGLAALLVGGRAAFATARARAALERAQLRIPGLGGVLRQTHATRLLLNLGTLLASRVPLLEAVGIVEELLPRAVYAGFFAELHSSIESGRGLAAAFAHSGLFPPTVQEMLQTGESSAALDRIMLRLAEFYEEELQERIRVFLQILEPALLVGMGIVVAGISLSLLLPILKLSGSVR